MTLRGMYYILKILQVMKNGMNTIPTEIKYTLEIPQALNFGMNMTVMDM